MVRPRPLLFVLLPLLLLSFWGTHVARAQSAPVYTDLDFELAAEQDLPFTYQFPPYLFTDPDSDPLTYAIRDDNAQDVSWLTFNPTTKTLSGTPDATDVGVGIFELIITATDDEGLPHSTDSRIIYITMLGPGGNTAPFENATIPDQSANTGSAYAYTIPLTTILDNQSFTLKYVLTLDNGNPIPSWLTFDSWRRELSGTPAVPDVGTLGFRFGAFDQNGEGNFSYFQFTVINSSAHNITSVSSISDINVAFGTPFASISFPSQVQVTLDDASTTMLNVTFSPGTYNPNVAGTHSIEGTLTLTPLVTNSLNLKAHVNVILPIGNQTITYAPDPLPAKTVADISTTFSMTSTASSGLPVSYVSADPLVASISGSTVTINGGGSTLITAKQSGSANYNPAPDVSRTLTVSRLSQTITFNALSPVNFGSGTFNLTATASSGLTVTYSSSDINVVTISGNTVTLVHAGTVTITALQAGNSMYDPATPVDRVLVVNKGNQVITFGPLPGKNRSDPPFTVSATVDTGLPITYGSSVPAVATISPPGSNTVAIQGIGVTTISANQAGNADYNPTSVGQPLTVGGQTITFGTLADKDADDPPFGLTASSSSGLAVSYTSSNPAVATVLGSVVTIVGPGTTDITASQAGNIDYLPATPVVQPFTVLKANQTITFGALPGKLVTDPPFALTATASSGLTVSYSSSDPAVATVSGSTVTIVGGGTTTITASQAGNGNFNPAPNVDQVLTVSKLSQTITFGPLADKLSTDPPFALSATASSGLTVSFISSNPAVATVSGTTVTITGSGTTFITASQAGNATYAAAPTVQQPLTVIANGDPQTITFSPIPDKTLGDAPFNITATASSGLPVTFSTTSSKISLSVNQVTLVQAGRASIAANQSGNGAFNPAPTVTQSFCIKPPKPTITSTLLGTNTYLLTSSAPAGNQWFLNNVAVTGSTGINFTALQSGNYSVQVTIDDCQGVKADNFTIVIVGDIDDPQSTVKIYPNPVGNELFASWPEAPGTTHLRIYQLDGKEIDQVTTSGNEVSIPVGHYAGGQYVLSIQTSKAHYQGRFLKQ